MKTTELIQAILTTEHEIIGQGAGRALRRWTKKECELAEYAESLERKNDEYLADLLAMEHTQAANDRLERELAEARAKYKRLAQHHNEKCTCRDIY